MHSEEEALGTRITIDSLTCLLANESDPSRLIASSPGKLVRYLVSDGSHVKTDQPYAEVEVMKMMMPLLSSAAGHMHFNLSEASVMNAGDLIATLDLDDPEAVTKAEAFQGDFPELGPPQVYSSGVDHRFKMSLKDATMNPSCKPISYSNACVIAIDMQPYRLSKRMYGIQHLVMLMRLCVSC